MLPCLEKHGWALKYASNALKNDKEVVLAAVSNWGSALQFASYFWNDKDVLLAAVQTDGEALEWADDELKNDKEVVLAAVQESGKALQWASKEMKHEKEVVLTAVQEWAFAMKYASDALQNDREILSWASLTKGQSLWRKLREHSLLDTLVKYWGQQTMKATFDASGNPIMQGRGAKRAREEFESDFI